MENKEVDFGELGDSLCGWERKGGREGGREGEERRGERRVGTPAVCVCVCVCVCVYIGEGEGVRLVGELRGEFLGE